MSSGHYAWLELKWPKLIKKKEKKEWRSLLIWTVNRQSSVNMLCLPRRNEQRNVWKLALFSLVLAIVLVSINYASFSSIVGYKLAHENGLWVIFVSPVNCLCLEVLCCNFKPFWTSFGKERFNIFLPNSLHSRARWVPVTMLLWPLIII